MSELTMQDPAPTPSDPGAAADRTAPDGRLKQVVAERNEWQKRFAELETAARSAAVRVGELERALAARGEALAQAESGALKLRVAYANGLPLDLAERLQGAEEAQLVEDARRLAAFLKPASPGVPPVVAGAPAPPLDLKRMSPAEIRQARAEGKI